MDSILGHLIYSNSILFIRIWIRIQSYLFVYGFGFNPKYTDSISHVTPKALKLDIQSQLYYLIFGMKESDAPMFIVVKRLQLDLQASSIILTLARTT